jgi:hypothetical protein
MRCFCAILYILLEVGDEILNFESKNFEFFLWWGLEVELLRAAEKFIEYFVLNLTT